MTARLPHALRSDAVDNRERILDAARAVFAAEGLNVPMPRFPAGGLAAAHWPEFAASGKHDVKVRHLLSVRSPALRRLVPRLHRE